MESQQYRIIITNNDAYKKPNVVMCTGCIAIYDNFEQAEEHFFKIREEYPLVECYLDLSIILLSTNQKPNLEK